jgi:hypothetical protein
VAIHTVVKVSISIIIFESKNFSYIEYIFLAKGRIEIYSFIVLFNINTNTFFQVAGSVVRPLTNICPLGFATNSKNCVDVQVLLRHCT